MNRYKGLNLTVFLKTSCYRFITLYRRQFKTLLKGKKKCKEAKWLSEEGLQIAEKRTEVKDKGKIHPAECRVPENSKER